MTLIAAPGQTMTYILVNMKTEQIVDILTLNSETNAYPAQTAKNRFSTIRTPDDRIFIMLGGEEPL